MTTARKPQVGETWWNGRKEKCGPLVHNEKSKEFTLKDNHGWTYREDGSWFSRAGTSDDLSHIHSDARRVINPKFKDRNKEPMEKELVDPMTVDWPREAFEVGMEVMIKPEMFRYMVEDKGFDLSKPLKFDSDDKTDSPWFIDCKGVIKCAHFTWLVPLHKIKEYEAATKGKPMKPPKPPKPGPYDLEITKAYRGSHSAQERLDGLRTLKQKEEDHKARNTKDAGERRARLAEIAELKARWMPSPKPTPAKRGKGVRK